MTFPHQRLTSPLTVMSRPTVTTIAISGDSPSNLLISTRSVTAPMIREMATVAAIAAPTGTPTAVSDHAI